MSKNYSIECAFVRNLVKCILGRSKRQADHYGVLANHPWSFAGADDRADVSASFVQPFLSFTTARQTTYGINSEIG